MLVRLGVGHAGVAVAEHLDLVEADDLRPRRPARRRASRPRAAFSCFGRRGRGTAGPPRAATGSAGRPPRRPCSTRARCGRPRRGTGPGRGALGRLVVGVRVHGQQGELPRCRTLTWSATWSVTRRRLSATAGSGLYARSVRRRRPRPFVLVLATVAVLSVAACDTGDGKQLRPFDPDSTTTSTQAPTIDTGTLPSVPIESTPDNPLGVAGTDAEPVAAGFRLFAPWAEGAPIDARHTCDGDDISPAVSWSAPPAGTIEMAVSLVDESARRRRPALRPLGDRRDRPRRGVADRGRGATRARYKRPTRSAPPAGRVRAHHPARPPTSTA